MTLRCCSVEPPVGNSVIGRRSVEPTVPTRRRFAEYRVDCCPLFVGRKVWSGMNIDDLPRTNKCLDTNGRCLELSGPRLWIPCVKREGVHVTVVWPMDCHEGKTRT